MARGRRWRLLFYIDANGEHRWTLRGTNGRTVAASSEGFSSARRCRENAERTLIGLQRTIGAT